MRLDPVNAVSSFHYYMWNAWGEEECKITFPEEQDDPVWVIWFNWDGDPYECKVMGVKVTDNSMTVIAHDKICNDEVTCSTPFELGAKNIDWLYEIYDAVWQQLEENGDNNA